MGVTGCCGTGRFCLQTWVSWKPGYSGMTGKVPVLVLLGRLRLAVPRQQAELREGWARPGPGASAATWGGLQSCLWPVLRHVAEAGPSMSHDPGEFGAMCIPEQSSSPAIFFFWFFPLSWFFSGFLPSFVLVVESPLTVGDAECRQTRQTG